MLIWIKAPCVAIGVLAIFLVLLSTAISEEILLNSTLDDINSTELAEAGEVSTVELMHLPFASSLRNPCSSESATNRPTYITEGHRASFTVEFFKIIAHYASNYQENVQEVLRNHAINGCAALHVTNLPKTPTLEELQEMDVEEALNKIYSSLLTHAAYAYYIHHQFTTSAIRCSEDIEGEQSLASESRELAKSQKSLACYIRVGITALGYKQNDVSSVLNLTITDLSQCSRRALRDCQVINSIHNFLKLVADYAADLS